MLFKEKCDAYEYLKHSGKPIAVYGMGNGADKIFHIFQEKGIDVAAVFASDDFVRGQSFRGFQVKSYLQVCDELKDFIIVPAFATRLPEVMQRMDKFDKEHEVRFLELPVIGEEAIDLNYIEQNSKAIDKVFHMLYDAKSKEVFSSLLEFRISGKLEYLRTIMTDRSEIFSLMGIGRNEIYADLGAYDGDTIQELVDITGGYAHVIAVEPDRKNFRKLEQYASDKKDITLVNKAVYSHKTLLHFNDKAGRNSSLDVQGRCEIIADSPDNIFMQSGFKNVTYAKFDVEGAEKEALLGMTRTMRSFQPKLCVSAYHRRQDLWELPLLIRQINPNYKIAIRKHLYYPGWETAIYCW